MPWLSNRWSVVVHQDSIWAARTQVSRQGGDQHWIEGEVFSRFSLPNMATAGCQIVDPMPPFDGHERGHGLCSRKQ